ncbi:hypothetical protein DEJ17_06540 [Curtobacterium sp. MCSS17_011]|uniref:DUF6270 domain-containing protein n=1 Tax=Curtobacterium sp. MCSS17_011 TaxID=2175643 RepID=UPI000D8823CE|nr:DUF6270 domain-containing protein [Curtobacterium sp. MCSS17_011]PYY60024.1 hypothetical protein DEJ17_06540 [Curtobacterium sp. MCSS17_011]
MSARKVAIIGSCVTREAFITENNPRYKTFYEIGPVGWQTSLVSFMSAPIPEAAASLIEPSESMNAHNTKTMRRDITKADRDEIRAYQPEVLIFDLYSDLRYGYIEYAGAYLTNNSNNLRKTDFFKAGAGFTKSHMVSAQADYLPVFKEKFDAFVQWARTELPNTTLVLNAFRFSSHFRIGGIDFNFVRYVGDTKNDKKWRAILRENDILDELYRWIAENYSIDVIDLRDRAYFADGNHKYGVTPWHFGRPFFEDFIASLNELMMTKRSDAPTVAEVFYRSDGTVL